MYSELLINGLGKARQVTENGRTFLVAPVTLIVPGVLPGSKGPLYYPPDEIRNSASAWNHIPLTLYHPFDPISGEHLSAQDSGVLQRQGIGTLKFPVWN